MPADIHLPFFLTRQETGCGLNYSSALFFDIVVLRFFVVLLVRMVSFTCEKMSIR